MGATVRPDGIDLRRGPTGLAVLDELDVYAGHPFGRLPHEPLARTDDDPVAAIRAALLPALTRSPCLVAFSGGRDSSALLAIAAETATQEGLPRPVACTLRYPGDPAADESSWQELVIRHLRTRGHPLDWATRDVVDDVDLVGPLAAPVLVGHGAPTFPAAIGPTVLLSAAARGGALVTGNFGDEVLGDHRATLLRAVWRRRGRRLAARDWRAAATAAAPLRTRTRLLRAQVEELPWLRSALRERVMDCQVADAATLPLRWDSSVREALRPRAVLLGNVTRRRIAHDHDTTLAEPLGSPEFISAFARRGGRWGRIGRGAAVSLLAGDLLPAEIAARRDKAYFNRSRFGPISRDFATRWDGRGVDPDLVDPEALRMAWLSDIPPASSALLLHQAWLCWKGKLR